ncbi:hypothetical protein ACP70R_014118 [Stipagrostis hirtigluma subsp. patula]
MGLDLASSDPSDGLDVATREEAKQRVDGGRGQGQRGGGVGRGGGEGRRRAPRDDEDATPVKDDAARSAAGGWRVGGVVGRRGGSGAPDGEDLTGRGGSMVALLRRC